MILGFSKYWDKAKTEPTHFKEKILAGEKMHTIRLDPHNRWKAGNSIQFAYGVRTPQYECFKNGLCVGVQLIHIHEGRGYKYPYIDVSEPLPPTLGDGEIQLVDFTTLSDEKIELLAQNDGFDSVGAFLRWFSPDNKTFDGSIIHWTDLIY